MGFFKNSFLLICALIAVASEAAQVAPKSPPAWSQTFTVKGVLHIPYAEIEEPFYGWYDGVSQQSRIDYYGDMVKTYQLTKTGPYGTSLKIAPMTTETQTNVRTCFQVNGTKEDTIDQQSVLPDIHNFIFVGEEIVGGIQTEKWQLQETIGQKDNKYTIWLYYKGNPQQAIPLRYEMRGYNSLLGSHYDHYYLEYNFYDSSPIPANTFAVDPNLVCTEFPGPGSKHLYTFNPMAEFVRPVREDHLDFEFDKFKVKHDRSYDDEVEHTKRKEVFRQNIRLIHSHNRKNKGYFLAVNHLADKTDNELKVLRGRIYSGGYNGGAPFPYANPEKEDVPDQFDWRILGAVTPVKDQSVCGSCWSFGTVGTIEGALYLKNGGHLIRLSQQALIDCSWGFGNNGCDGGEDFRSYQWMLKEGGIPTEEDYGPYLGQDGYCHIDKVPKLAKLSGYVNVTSNNEDALRLALFKHGPISVAIDASRRTFTFYSNGVFYDPECKNNVDGLDHAVLAVGYGSLNGQHYWLVKNSWSNYWGNDGYVLISAKDNNCGVMTTPTYVTLV